MSDFIHRGLQVRSVLADASLPKWERVCKGIEAFDGLELSTLPPDMVRQFEAELVVVNGVLSGYSLETPDDYAAIEEGDLDEMLAALDRAAAQGMDAELERIIRELDKGRRKLPVQAIQEAREHRELIIPKLIEVLRQLVSNARQGAEPTGNSHFFAVFLLSEFEAEEAFPVILEAFSLPGELPCDLFGDAATSTLARILAQFTSHRPEVVDALIRDPEINEYVRWQAVDCYVHYVRDGHLTREEAVERLRQHLRWAIDQQDEHLAGGIVCTLTTFAPEEAMPEIHEAYRLELVYPGLVDLKSVERMVEEGEAGMRADIARYPETGISDTIEELRTWASFQDQPGARRAPPKPHFPAVHELLEPAPASTARSTPHVGRNDPCPCGSGKKFKKCCLRG